MFPHLSYRDEVCENERRIEEEEKRCQAQRLLKNAAWLERERLAQEVFRKKKELEEQRKKEKEEREVCLVFAVIWYIPYFLHTDHSALE